MNFCKVCMNLLELRNTNYQCNNCDYNVPLNNNSILFHSQIQKNKNNIVEENINTLKKYDIYRNKKDNNNNEFLLYNDIHFNSKNIYKK